MGAALFVGRVGGLAVALGVGAAIVSGTAVALADDSPSRDSSSAGPSRSSSASESRHATAGTGGSSQSTRVRAGSARKAPVVSTPDEPVTIPRAAASSRVATAAVAPTAVVPSEPATTAAPANNSPAPTVVAGPAASVRAPSAAAAVPSASAAVTAAAAEEPVDDPGAPDPDATVETPYGDLGKWMLNKDGDIADWVGIPYCTGDTCKTMQEPINVIFTVEAKSKWWAEARLNWKLRQAGFPPSCCSSVGYQAILDQIISQQMPRGGILGVGVLGPGNFQRGLLGLLAGIGPAYRDAFFMTTNSHMRTFGGVSDGNGNWVFTGSVSKEYYTTIDGKPTHGYESFDQARDKLLSDMVAAGNTDLGLVAMHNAIPADDPDYTTGDADGYAQVIAITGMAGMAWRPFQR